MQSVNENRETWGTPGCFRSRFSGVNVAHKPRSAIDQTASVTLSSLPVPVQRRSIRKLRFSHRQLIVLRCYASEH